MRHRSNLAGILALALAVACSNGDDDSGGGPSVDVHTTSGDVGVGTELPGVAPLDACVGAGCDAKGPPGASVEESFNTPCLLNEDCPSGWCIEGPVGRVCTKTCIDDCPDGWFCKGITNLGSDVTYICVPNEVGLCTPCTADSECGGPDDRCVVISAEGGYCSRACAELNPCPSGYICSGDAGGLGTKPQCVPETGSCICTPDLLGTSQPCKALNEIGTCWGFQTCAGEGGWGPCDAPEPTTEACDGVDNDCDGATDEGTGGAPCVATSELGSCQGEYLCMAGGLACTALPPAPEGCNGLDDDCDGLTDEDLGDMDGDGLKDCEDDDIDGDGDPNVGDCDPYNAQRFHGAPEVCDGLDDDCDGKVPLDEVDADADGVFACEGDCDDTKAEVGPGDPELCDGLDNDCDLVLGEGEVDGDGDQWLVCQGDCDDVDPARHPGAQEACNTVDDDCDGLIDEPGADGCAAYYVDADQDGAGTGAALCLCAATATHTAPMGGDCDEANAAISPLADEACNEIDDDCDGITDEAGALGCQAYLVDNDKDGFGATGAAACLCKEPEQGAAVVPGDCDDDASGVHPGAPEGCDGIDTNCDGDLGPGEQDADGDGYRGCQGDCNDKVAAVNPGAEEVCDGVDTNCDGVLPESEHDDDKDGWPVCKGDCNDWNDGAWPGAPEVCGGGDENCDDVVDEPGATGCTSWYPDADGDGFGPSALGQCVCGATEALTVPYGGDCDDGDPLEKPGSNAPCKDNADCCQAGSSCQYGYCVAGPEACGDSDDCWGDTYCIAKKCIPFGIGPGQLANDGCSKVNQTGLFLPTLQCQWTGPPAGDAFPNHKNVLGTVTVADFDLDGDPTVSKPSIVFVSYEGTDGGFASASSNGVIRVLDSDTCAQKYSLGAQKVVGASPVAMGDLDLAPDKRPEIVAFREGGGLVAFKYDAATDAFKVHWVAKSGGVTSTLAADVYRWNGPTITELDGDEWPEVMMGSVVFDHDGNLRAQNLGYVNYSVGIFDVIADVDLDGKPEYVNGNAVYGWTGNAWVQEPYVKTLPGLGQAAVADFGDYPVAGLGAGIAEVAVIRSGFASIQDLSGKVVFGPYQLLSWPPGTDIGTGGPPTIGDFDGDGIPELAASGKGAITVFDQGCTASPLPLGCMAPGILWFRYSQDYSSSVTGSSIYDFEADGLAEAVYSDECFTRIYQGGTGDVTFSQWRSSCTWYENPIVADIDGDFKAEIVVGSNTNCNIQCPKLDPVFRGLVCTSNGDCPSANGWCDVGRCRCNSDEDCGPPESSYVCDVAIANTPGKGKVCRAKHGGPVSGVRVYRDVADNWVVARPIWNQHAYSSTNVTDAGQIPPAGSVPPNWQTPGLNNFRQNSQGKYDPTLAPDLTTNAGLVLNCDDAGELTIPVEICNRGALPVVAGIAVGFFDGDPLVTGEVACLETTKTILQPEDCETVTCQWLVPDAAPHDIYVYSDYGGPKGENKECLEQNNQALFTSLTCKNL